MNTSEQDTSQTGEVVVITSPEFDYSELILVCTIVPTLVIVSMGAVYAAWGV